MKFRGHTKPKKAKKTVEVPARKARKRRSNAGVKRGSYKTGRTRSGMKFRGRNTPKKSNKKVNTPVKKARKRRSNAGKKRGPYGKRTGKTRSGHKFR
jgi:hypothetical protein